MKLFLISLSLLSLCLVGCSGSAKPEITAANAEAANNPDAAVTRLFAEYEAQDPGDREAWVRNNDFAWKVIQNAQDPALKAKYDQTIKPILGH